MPGLFVFLLKVNIALLVFCAGYYLVLRQLTFYTLNRIYLVTAILFASVYPKINLSGFFELHRNIANPVQAIVYNLQAPAKHLIKPLDKHDYWQWAGIVFWLGATVLAIRLFIQFISLFRIYRKSKAGQINGHEVRIISGNSGPFSFWKNIYINPEMHSTTDLPSILLHEQVHVSELHTLDILLGELSAIFYWFNPGIWLIKKAIRENIEFITDRKILTKGVDTKQYQYSLVNVSFSAAPQGIVNHFNISTIKKRIIMMNAKRSSKINLTRYAILVPVVVALLLVFGISRAALIKKSGNAGKVVAAEIKSAIGAGNVTKMTVNTSMAANENTANKIISITKKDLDTVRNGGFFLSTSQSTDSLKYIINGVKSTKADFKALDPDHIISVDLVSAEQANALLNENSNKHSVLFVTTDDSDSGKKLKERIDKLNHMAKLVVAGNGSVAVTNSSSDNNSSGANLSTGSSNTSGSDVVIVESAPKVYKFRPRKSRTLMLKSDTLASVTREPVVIADAYAEPDTIRVMNLKVDKGAYTISPKLKLDAKPRMAYSFKGTGRTFSNFSGKTLTLNSNGNNETNIEHLSAKMIMIDGKEATEKDLKKLSAARIESMSVKSGDEVTKKYGDKAKNGVVFITTKK
ncbi:M56 family metallopeptidase [Mucilaginibacter gotjawali]|uniref:Beta-lactamase regulating signal transducer with metallopeptidase domain n=2 Tax=Mucilaginibacter gotjawali TaxID=1550579 RepID=A0A839S8M9_9SPHI|nr:M56 family metallopeptidase [Mucilaginibacter gotjawali]MBB3053714.1 beta-lactamase regulating signal transducer with metallopeptidase domain [Mucilaginibacter gotjawali]BAU53973.1 BlaR1 peptidase M56 [Mucilaginibacter gotjawali]